MATPITYEFSLTGVCDNPGNGAVSISVSGGTTPYTVDNTIPGFLSSQTGNGPFLFSGLTADTYVFRVNDSLGNVNTEFFINANVSGCFCANIINTTGTSCGSNNGQFTVTNTSVSSPYSYQLYKNGSPQGSSIDTNFSSYTYSNLSSGIYSVLVTDTGGATAFTESSVIEESSLLDFGYYVIPESPCSPGFGSATVTGQTGQPPYTYIWSNGQTGSTATGITTGSVSVQVTDNVGCVREKNIIIPIAQPLGIISTTPTNSSCFNCDGELLVTISGGTPPFTYNGSNGQVHTTNQTSYLLTGLCEGGYTVIVNDVAGCTTSASEIINSTAGFDVISINTTNSTCGQSGQISISIAGPQNIFTYTIEDESGNTESITTQQQSHTFANLSSGVYTLTIESDTGQCVYTTEKTIVSSQKFNVSLSTTGATCGNSTGIIEISVVDGEEPIYYPLDYVVTNISTNQVEYQNINTSTNPELIGNLPAGTYDVSVTDNQGCEIVETVIIPQTNGVVMNVSSTNCFLGNDGTATVNIFDGEPPFNVLWSNGETSLSINGLSGGTYNVVVTDNNGCIGYGSVIIDCKSANVSSYQLNTICEKDFITTVGAKRDFLSMVNETYLDISSGQTNCVVNEIVYCLTYGFTGDTWISGGTTCYYTGNTLTDVPSEQDWITAIENVLNGINEITGYNINGNTNELSIELECEQTGTKFELISRIEMDLSCDPQITPTPTPTNTSTPTPTPTVTSTLTPTPTITPSPQGEDYNITVVLTSDACAKGGVLITKNGTQSLLSYYHDSGDPILSGQSFVISGILIGDVIEVEAVAYEPTGLECTGLDTEVDVFEDLSQIIDIDSSGGSTGLVYSIGTLSSDITITANITSV